MIYRKNAKPSESPAPPKKRSWFGMICLFLAAICLGMAVTEILALIMGVEGGRAIRLVSFTLNFIVYMTAYRTSRLWDRIERETRP